MSAFVSRANCHNKERKLFFFLFLFLYVKLLRGEISLLAFETDSFCTT